MGTINLQWAADGIIDSYSIYRDTAPINPESLPEVLATGVLVKNYQDTAVVDGVTYYYRVASVSNSTTKISDEVSVKAEAGDEHWNDVIALLHFNENFTDEKGNTWGVFGSGNVPSITATVSLFDQSLDCNPAQAVSNNGFQASSLSALPLSGDFTIEWWQYIKSWNTPTYQAIIDNGYNSSGGITIVTGDQNGKYAVYGGSTLICSETTAGAAGEWVHYALTRSGSGVTLWRDGSVSADGSFSSSIGLAYRPFAVGAYASDSGATGQMLNGYIDEFRMTKGIARYTANFTPPGAPFPNS